MTIKRITTVAAAVAHVAKIDAIAIVTVKAVVLSKMTNAVIASERVTGQINANNRWKMRGKRRRRRAPIVPMLLSTTFRT